MNYDTKNIPSADFVFNVVDKNKLILSDNEIEYLLELAKDGNIQARNKIIECFYLFSLKMCRKYSNLLYFQSVYDTDDLFQYCILIIIESIDKYDASRSKFITYLSLMIRSKFLMLFRKKKFESKLISLQEIIGDEDFTIEKILPVNDHFEEDVCDRNFNLYIMEILERYYNTLPDIEKNVFDYSYGLHNKEILSTNEISEKLNLRNDRVYKYKNAVINNFRIFCTNNKISILDNVSLMNIFTYSKMHNIPYINIDKIWPTLDYHDKYLIMACYGYNGSVTTTIRSVKDLLGYSKKSTVYDRLKILASPDFTRSEDYPRYHSRIDDIVEKLNHISLKPNDEYIIRSLYGLNKECKIIHYNEIAEKINLPVTSTNAQFRVHQKLFSALSNLGIDAGNFLYDTSITEEEIRDRYFGFNNYERQDVDTIAAYCQIDKATVYKIVNSFKSIKNIKDYESEFTQNMFKMIDENFDDLYQYILHHLYHYKNYKPVTIHQIASKFHISDALIRMCKKDIESLIKDESLLLKRISDMIDEKEFILKYYDRFDSRGKLFVDYYYGLHGKKKLSLYTISILDKFKKYNNINKSTVDLLLTRLRILEVLTIKDIEEFLSRIYKPSLKYLITLAFGYHTEIVVLQEDIFNKTETKFKQKMSIYALRNYIRERILPVIGSLSESTLNEKQVERKIEDYYTNEKYKIVSEDEFIKELNISQKQFYQYASNIFRSKSKNTENIKKSTRKDIYYDSVLENGMLLSDIIEARYPYLDDTEKLIIDYSYGIHGKEKLSQAKIAKKLNIKYPQYISNLKRVILQKMIHEVNASFIN